MLGIIVSLVLAGFYATIENDIEFSQYCIGHASRLICATCLLAILDDLALMSEPVSQCVFITALRASRMRGQ